MIAIVTSLVSLRNTILSKQKKNDLLENHYISIGLVESCLGGKNYSITYTYSDIHNSNVKISVKRPYTLMTNSLCKQIKNKKFWVIYSPDDPIFSLIYLSEEITDSINAKFPKSLNGFR